MEVELFQNLVGRVGPSTTFVDPVERVTLRDVECLAMGRDGGDTGGYAKADVTEVTQLLHHTIYLLSVRHLRIENGFRIIEGGGRLFRGQE